MASYKVAYILAKSGKPFTDGEVVKDPFILLITYKESTENTTHRTGGQEGKTKTDNYYSCRAVSA